MNSVKALVIVDVQNDFAEGGALPVAGGTEVARRIAEYAKENADNYAALVATFDWHSPDDDNGGHFAAPGATPDYRDTWPPHCIAGTPGAAWHSHLLPLEGALTARIHKGTRAPAFSGFEGSTPDGESLTQLLRGLGITEVDIVGIATDYCVKATALDAVSLGFETRVILDLCAAVSPGDTRLVAAQLAAAGIHAHEMSTA